MTEEVGRDRLLKVLSYRTGHVTEEGTIMKVDGELMLRGSTRDTPMAAMEPGHLYDLLMQTGHTGFFP